MRIESYYYYHASAQSHAAGDARPALFRLVDAMITLDIDSARRVAAIEAARGRRRWPKARAHAMPAID